MPCLLASCFFCSFSVFPLCVYLLPSCERSAVVVQVVAVVVAAPVSSNNNTMLSQNDFRKLLAKGKEGEGGDKNKAASKGAAAGGGGATSKGAGDKKKGRRKRSYQEYLARKEQKKAEAQPAYRDRAAERQQGKLVDYAGTEAVLKNISVEHSKVRWVTAPAPARVLCRCDLFACCDLDVLQR